MDGDTDLEGALPGLSPELQGPLDDPEIARARAAIEAQILGIPAIATRIARFVVLERLGSGGMGIVYAAFDPQLDRKVAIKLLFARHAGTSERARVVGEAKAMAKLAHPNVVHVYEVDEHEGHMFVAMEYVRGQTLRKWCTKAPRSVREILAVCLQAGEGLAAAHAAGIVHRDFKPDNVMVGDDMRGDAIGRARVLDFGLARAFEEPTDPGVGGEQPSEPCTLLTRNGAIKGTPGYLAPEQLRGVPADVYSDQFAFCITTWEALVGTPPFAGNTVETRLQAILAGRIEPPPRTKMPQWIERLLRRGLAHDPEAPHRGRHASLDELLRALSRDPGAVRRRWLGAAVVTAGILGAFAAGNTSRGEASTDDVCSGGVEAIAQAWSSDARSAAVARIESLGNYGAAAGQRIAVATERYATEWVEAHRDACEAHRRGEQSAELLDRRMTCLHRASAAFATLGKLSASVEVNGLPGLTTAAGMLPTLSRCADIEALGAISEPAPPEASAAIARLGENNVLISAGETSAAIVASNELLAEARRLGYRPLLAEALYQHAYALLDERSELRVAAIELHEAMLLALAVGDDRLAVRAWGAGAWAQAVAPPETVTASGVRFEGREQMAAIAERVIDVDTMGFFLRIGKIEIASSNPTRAREAFARANELAEQLDADYALSAIGEGLGMTSDDPVDRMRHFDAAILASTEVYGPEHPRTLGLRGNRSLSHADPRRMVEELTALCAEQHAFFPEDLVSAAECESTVMMGAERTGEPGLALAAAQRWQAAARGDPMAEGTLALLRGDPAAAASTLAPVVDAWPAEPDAPFFVWLQLGQAEITLGRAWRELGDARAAAMLALGLAHVERAAAGQKQPWVHHVLAHARFVAVSR